MVDIVYTPQTIRVPNLPMGQIVDKDGNATDDELTFRHILITSLQNNFGAEGVVVPTQDATNIAIIEANREPNPIALPTVPGAYTCAFGTILYNSTANSIMIAVDGGGGVPLFKTVTLT